MVLAVFHGFFVLVSCFSLSGVFWFEEIAWTCHHVFGKQKQWPSLLGVDVGACVRKNAAENVLIIESLCVPPVFFGKWQVISSFGRFIFPNAAPTRIDNSIKVSTGFCQVHPWMKRHPGDVVMVPSSHALARWVLVKFVWAQHLPWFRWNDRKWIFVWVGCGWVARLPAQGFVEGQVMTYFDLCRLSI